MIFIFMAIAFVIVFIVLAVVLQSAQHKSKFQKAQQYLQSGRLDEAMRSLNELALKDPSNRVYNWYIGQCFEKMKNYEMALVEYNKVALSTRFEEPISEVELHKRIALLNLKLGNVKTAFQEFQTVISLDPQNAETYYYLGTMSKNKGELQRGVDYFDKAVRCRKEYPEAYLELGKLHYFLNHFDKAKRALLQAISQNADLSEAHFYYGLALENDRAYDKSIEELRRSGRDERFAFDSFSHLGSIYIALADTGTARECFEKAIELGTSNVESLLDAKYKYADFLIQTGELNRAMKLWNEIISIRPRYRDVESKLQVYDEISKSKNLTRFITSLRSDFISTGREICRLLNFRVDSHESSKDDFVEFVGTYRIGREESPCVLHLARWTNPVGEIPLRELLERMVETGALKGIFVTASHFSEKAQDISRIRPLVLVERERLEQLLERIYI